MNLIRRLGSIFTAFILLLSLGLTSAFAAQTSGQSMTVTATVPVPEYYVQVPQSISFNQLSLLSDNIKPFQLVIGNEYYKPGYSIHVTASNIFVLTSQSDGKSTLNCYNSLTDLIVTGEGEHRYEGSLTIKAGELLNALPGGYSGSVMFDISYEKDDSGSGSGSDSGSGSGGDSGGNSGSTEEGNYSCPVSMRKSTDINSLSMCSPLFYKDADVAVSGDMATVRIYVIDPIPGFSDAGTPLTSVKFIYNGQTYTADIETINQVTKSFTADGTFVLQDGDYTADVITVTLPKAALEASKTGGLLCEAYVNAVMKTDVSFYPVFGDLTGGTSTGGSTSDGTSTGGSTSGGTSTGSSTSSGTSTGISTGGSASTGTSTGSGTTGSSTGSSTGSDSLSSGNYTCRVIMKKSTDITQTSMCDPLIYDYADLTVNGDMTTMTLYVIDPIPQYSDTGTPLANISFTANDGSYSASINPNSKVNKSFDAASGFIPTSGSYPASPITVTVPTSAIMNSANGTLLCNAYVAAVMKQNVSFYVVISEITAGKTSGSAASGGTTASTTSGTSTGTTGTTGSGTTAGNFSAENASTGTMENGDYIIPVTAFKETSDETSMLADYLYPKASLHVEDGNLDLSIYVLHTVSGIDGGGVEYMTYNGVRADKTESGFVGEDGQVYDVFTFHLTDELESPMPVSMHVNAVDMDVSARLIFDLTGMTEGELSQGTAEVESVPEETTAAENVVQEEAPAAAETQAEQKQEQPIQYILEPGTHVTAVLFILVTVLGAAAKVGITYWRKRR